MFIYKGICKCVCKYVHMLRPTVILCDGKYCNILKTICYAKIKWLKFQNPSDFIAIFTVNMSVHRSSPVRWTLRNIYCFSFCLFCSARAVTRTQHASLPGHFYTIFPLSELSTKPQSHIMTSDYITEIPKLSLVASDRQVCRVASW